MRYDYPVYFCRNGDSAYNAETGDYTDAEPLKAKRMASVTAASDEKVQVVYGQMLQGVLSVQLQNHYDEPFDTEAEAVTYLNKKFGVTTTSSSSGS